MTRFILESPLSEKLAACKGPVEFCDVTGRIVGRFYPEVATEDIVPSEPQVSKDELQRRRQSNVWLTTDQVLAHLKGLEGQ